jgi:general L-amino acid transport system permease protein
MPVTAFSRDNLLPERTPPANTIGPVAWLRENLFPSPFMGLLTVASIAATVWLLIEVLHWLIVPTVAVDSVGACQALLLELSQGSSPSGACWGVIRERWIQILFGFYPSELYWRVGLAFVAIALAVLPLFRGGLPRSYLLISLAGPFLAVWLLWGGSAAWLLLLSGFTAVIFALRRVLSGTPLTLAVIFAFAVLLGAGGAINAALSEVLPLGIRPVPSELFGGFMLSIIIGLTGIIASFPLGVGLALARQSRLPLLRRFAVAFIELIRAVPLITLLFVASILLNLFLPAGTKFDIILRVIIIVTLFSSAYIAEVIRGGLAAIPKGQYEAADSLGLTYAQSMRLIILPQALKISIPGIVSSFIALFKDTTLVSIIGLLDPIGLKETINGDVRWASINWEIYGYIAVVFFLLCFSMSRYAAYLERKLHTGHR